jgi:MFS family permease
VPGPVDGAAGSPWAPLHIGLFRTIWLAALASNIGSWMHLVAAAWLMTSLTASAALVALLQTANTAPGFLLAVPAGALADIVDRRKLILVAQSWQLVIAATLGVLTLAELTTPPVLLAMTLALAIGASLGLPAFSAITPELVPRDQLPAAISLNSVVLTGSQAVGPALGGLLVATSGSGTVFIVNAASFLAVVAAVGLWRRPARPTELPPEHVISAMRTGTRYVANAPEFRTVLIRAGAYVLAFSAMPALLAIFTRTRLDGSASDFGLLLGAVGVGGVTGAVVLPRIRRRVSADRIVVLATLCYGAVFIGLASTRTLAAAAPLLLVGGLAGMANMSSINIAGQSVLPDWVRGRGLALLQLTFMLSFAVGGALWGALATKFGVTSTLYIAGTGLAATAALSLWFRLSAADGVDVAISEQHEPYVPVALAPDDGPILVTVEYRIAPSARADFTHAAAELARARRRDGAMHWSVYTDPSDPARRIETFMVPSWSEHLRAGSRETHTDARAIQGVRALHTGAHEPQLTVLVRERFHREGRR